MRSIIGKMNNVSTIAFRMNDLAYRASLQGRYIARLMKLLNTIKTRSPSFILGYLKNCISGQKI
jgi:hypothetical protein